MRILHVLFGRGEHDWGPWQRFNNGEIARYGSDPYRHVGQMRQCLSCREWETEGWYERVNT